MRGQSALIFKEYMYCNHKFVERMDFDSDENIIVCELCGYECPHENFVHYDVDQDIDLMVCGVCGYN